MIKPEEIEELKANATAALVALEGMTLCNPTLCRRLAQEQVALCRPPGAWRGASAAPQGPFQGGDGG